MREAAERAADRKADALLDMAGNEYTVQLSRRDVPRVFYDAAEGAVAI